MQENTFFKENERKKIEKAVIKSLLKTLEPSINKLVKTNNNEISFNELFMFIVNKMRKEGKIDQMINEFYNRGMQERFVPLNLND